MRRYGSIAKLLHWLMAAVIVSAWVVGWWSSRLRLGVDATKVDMIFLHKNIATTGLFLIALRIAWRLTHPAPRLTLHAAFERRVAAAGHIALYAVMVCLPMSGWAWSSSAGYDIPVAGLFHLPPLVAKNEGWERVLGTVHYWLAWTTAALVLGHAAAALKHHLIDRDDTLRAMWPGRRERPE